MKIRKEKLFVFILFLLVFATFFYTDLFFEKAYADSQILSANSNFVNLLTHPIMRTILLIVGFVGLTIELFMPGFGPAGILSLIAFILFFYGGFIVGDAEVLELVLFMAGLVLMVVELFNPGFGAPGIAGIIMIVLGLVMASDNPITGLRSLTIALIVSVVSGFILIKRGLKSPYLERLVLTNASSERFNEKLEENIEASISTKVGATGVSLTPLRPAGTVDVNGKRVDAITQGEFVGKAVEVRIVQIEGSKVVVEEI